MPPVGTILRGARFQAGLSLEQISSRTRISPKILRAIEEDDLSQIASGFFYKSFVRQFCQELKIPYGQLEHAVDEAVAFYPEPFAERHLSTVLQRSLVKPRRRRFDYRVPIASAAAVLVLAGCSFLYSSWRDRGKFEGASAKVAELVESAESILPGSSRHSVDSSPTEKDAEVQPLLEEHGFCVELSALEPSWLSFTTDGRQAFNGILEPADHKVIEGHQTGRLRTGNAGGLSIAFNGKPMGVVGPRGQVRIVVFTRDNYEVLSPNPVHAAALIIPARFFLPSRLSGTGQRAFGLPLY